jgi:hypothetical protein
MKFYYIVHLPDSRSPQATLRELPVKFMERSQAQTICDELNRRKDKNDAGFIVEEREEQKLRSLRQSS